VSDISPIPFIDFNQPGLTAAQQGLTQAQTGLVGQQTQAAQIANANAALSYQLRRNAIMNLRGQQQASADFSGVGGADAPGSQPSPTYRGPQGGSDYDAASDDSGVDYGESSAHPGAMEQALRARYFVNPAGTPQEQNAISMAALSGDEGLLKMATMQRDMNVASRQYMNQQDARNHYDLAATVEDAPDGQAFGILQATMPTAAAKLQQVHPDATPEELDEIARDTTAHYLGAVHQYTGRELVKGDDGVYRDKETGYPVPVPVTGVSAQQYGELFKQANTLVSVKNSDGSESQVPQFKVNGYPSAAAWVASAVAQHNALASAPSHPTFAGTNMEQPGSRPDRASIDTMHSRVGLPPTGQLIAAGPPGAARAQPGTPQPGAQLAAAPAQPSQTADNGLLPGVDPRTLPRMQLPHVVAGRSQSPADAITANGIATERLAQLKDSNTQYAEAQKEQALIRAAQGEAANLANNTRLTGPGSEAAKAWAQVKTFVTGQPPDAYVDLGALDKLLLQMGAQNIRAALSGQRITNQEFMTLMTKGNPNTEQPLPTINKLLGYLGAQNDYDMRFQRTKQAALNSGANPMTVDSDLGVKVNRGDYVAAKTGVRPPQTGGGGPLPSRNAQGWVLHKDAQGRQAYVGPNGQYQLVQ